MIRITTVREQSFWGTAMVATEGAFDRNATNVSLVYYLYLSSIVLGVTAIVGLIIAYINRAGDADWLDSHYTYQIRTFWIGLLYAAIGLVLTFAVIGLLVLLFVLIWWVVRCVKGLKWAGSRAPVPQPDTWLW
jgi:uncharacterized membrane protein